MDGKHLYRQRHKAVNGRLIIAGADGYIGRRIQEKMPVKERIVLLSPVKADGYINLDLLDTSGFDYNLIGPGDAVVMLAAISSPDLCSSNFKMAFDVNVRGTINFIQGCLSRNARVLFFSSDTVYGNSPEENNEDILPDDPVGEYGRMKFLVERYFRGENGFKAFRLSYVFSWNDRYTSYLRSCLENKSTADIFDPFIRKAVYIEDLIGCVSGLTNNWDGFQNQYFNICGPEYLSRLDIANSFSKYIGSLDINIIRPDESFFRARPSKINISTKYSEALLGRSFTRIEEALLMEKARFLN